MSRRESRIDVTIAAVTLLVTLGVLATDGFGTPDARTHPLDAGGVLLAGVACLPLVARRTWPGVVFAVTSLGCFALLALGYPLDAPIAPTVAVFSLALVHSGAPRPAPRIAAAAGVAAFVPALTLTYALIGVEVTSILTEMLGWGAVLAGAWIAGDRARLRQERMAHLEERARRTEREVERERRLAAAEERTRIARELHDSAGHAINVILVQAGAARLLHERNAEGSRRAIATIEEVARDTIVDIDRMVRALRDSAEPTTTDHTRLEELVERYRASGLEVVADVRPARQALPQSVAWAAYRILQEALTNAARHGPGSAAVSVRAGADAVEITVTNPTTVRVAPARGGGHGIVGMRERATLLGGSLDVAATDGTFRLHARLPQAEPAP